MEALALQVFKMNNKIILALDQSSRTTGYSIYCYGIMNTFGHFTLKSTLPIEERLNQFMQELNELHNEFDFDEVVFEDIQAQNGNYKTYKTLAYIQAAIMIWCYNQNIKFTIYAPTHWRKIIKETYNVNFGRKREEQKTAAKIFVLERFPEINVPTEDECEAILIGLARVSPRAEENAEGF